MRVKLETYRRHCDGVKSAYKSTFYAINGDQPQVGLSEDPVETQIETGEDLPGSVIKTFCCGRKKY